MINTQAIAISSSCLFIQEPHMCVQLEQVVRLGGDAVMQVGILGKMGVKILMNFRSLHSL